MKDNKESGSPGGNEKRDEQNAAEIKKREERRDFIKKVAALGMANFAVLSVGARVSRGDDPPDPVPPVPTPECGTRDPSRNLIQDQLCGTPSPHGGKQKDEACGKLLGAGDPTLYSDDKDCASPQGPAGPHSDDACAKQANSDGHVWKDMSCAVMDEHGHYSRDDDCGEIAGPKENWPDNDCGEIAMSPPPLRHKDNFYD